MDQHQQELRSNMERATSIVNNQLGQLRVLYDRFCKIDTNFKNQIAVTMIRDIQRDVSKIIPAATIIYKVVLIS
jgi:hypothetical protein